MIEEDAWLNHLRIDPRPALRAWPDEALRYYVRRDLTHEPVGDCETLWMLPGAASLVKKQKADGSWKYPGKDASGIPGQNYSLLETYRSLRILVEMYGMNSNHPAIQGAAAYIFSCQTQEGDIRGILSNQYMPYYHGAILELLIKAGYQEDKRTLKGLDWLLAVRQDDGGWLVPMQAVASAKRTPRFWAGEPFRAGRSLPSSHLATGMALRAFAVHPDFACRPEAIAAGDWLKSRFFKADSYYDRQAPAYWLKYQFPFWWPNLLTAMDTLSRMGFDRQDGDVAGGLDWILSRQRDDGLWPTAYDSGRNAAANCHWVGLAVCRILKFIYSR